MNLAEATEAVRVHDQGCRMNCSRARLNADTIRLLQALDISGRARRLGSAQSILRVNGVLMGSRHKATRDFGCRY